MVTRRSAVQKLIPRLAGILGKRSPSLKDWTPYLISALSILCFNLIIFNRYLPLTEGWFSAWAWRIRNGDIPYRDFYLFLPPLYTVQIALFQKVFGPSIFLLRLAGIVLILGLQLGLYLNLTRMTTRTIAAFVSAVCILFYQHSNSHIDYDYIQFTNLYALFGLYALQRVEDFRSHKRLLWIGLSGLLMGLAWQSKHSNGTLIFAASCAGLVLMQTFQKRKPLPILKDLAAHVGGFLIPFVLFSIWLGYHSAFREMIQQLYFDGMASKGNPKQVFSGWLKEILNGQFAERMARILVFLLLWVPFSRRNLRKLKLARTVEWILLFLPTVLIFVLLFSPSIRLSEKTSIRIFTHFMAAGTLAPLAVFLYQCVRYLRGEKVSYPMLLISLIAMGMIVGGGTSAGLSHVSVYLGVALFLVIALSAQSIYGLGHLFLYLMCFTLLIRIIGDKFAGPYYWWKLTIPDIRTTKLVKLEHPSLHGMWTTPQNRDLIDRINRIVEKHSSLQDPIFCFPNIPLFYFLNERPTTGKAYVQWFDILPDYRAISEAKILEKRRPKVIIAADFDSSVWLEHEKLFRGGRPSGQRQIAEAIRRLTTKSDLYVHDMTESLSEGVVLKVWHRK